LGIFSGAKIIGLDIGSSYLKAIEIELSPRGGLSLSSFGMVPTPQESVANGMIINSQELVTSIQGLMSQSKMTSKSGITGLSGSSVIIKKITIPRVDSNVLKETIRFEAEQYIPFDINSVALTYVPLKANQNEETMDVLIIAGQNEVIIQYVEVVALSGLKCNIMDVNNFALANCFEYNYGIFPGETIGVMNFGHETTNFVVVNNGEVIFCRDLGVGGINFSNEISRSLGVTMAEAESFKVSAVSGLEVPDEVHSIIQAEIERFVEEIKNSFEFFSASNPNTTIDRYYFSGGASQMIGLVEQVAQALNAPFERFDPFKKVKISDSKMSPSYLKQISHFAPIAVGLAARGKGRK
jgi:type IV pilus assembly protein PilM